MQLTGDHHSQSDIEGKASSVIVTEAMRAGPLIENMLDLTHYIFVNHIFRYKNMLVLCPSNKISFLWDVLLTN